MPGPELCLSPAFSRLGPSSCPPCLPRGRHTPSIFIGSGWRFLNASAQCFGCPSRLGRLGIPAEVGQEKLLFNFFLDSPKPFSLDETVDIGMDVASPVS